jgi:hypothetical protein
MKQNTRKPFPAGFPSDLADAALLHSNEAAWRPELAVASIEWLGAHCYAVLGTEVLLPKHDSVQSLPYFQRVDRRKDETWESFVARSTDETTAYLKTITEIVTEEGDVYINVTWASEAEVQK